MMSFAWSIFRMHCIHTKCNWFCRAATSLDVARYKTTLPLGPVPAAACRQSQVITWVYFTKYLITHPARHNATSYDFRIPQILKLSEINKNDGSVLRSTARLDCNIAITNVVWKALSPRWWVDQQQVKQQHILISKPSQLPALFNRPEFGPRTKIFVLFMQETLTQKFIKEEKPVQWLHQTIQIYLTKWYNFINIYKIVYY